MSPPIPTTKELADGIISGISAAINQTIPSLFKAFVRILANVLSGVLIVLYKFASFFFFEILVATASFGVI